MHVPMHVPVHVHPFLLVGCCSAGMDGTYTFPSLKRAHLHVPLVL